MFHNAMNISDYPSNILHNSKNCRPATLERRPENVDHLRISHEHTDSGLGTEQDCIYNSEK